MAPVTDATKGFTGHTGHPGLTGHPLPKEESSTTTTTKGPTVSEMSVHEYNQSTSAYTEGTKKHISAAVAEAVKQLLDAYKITQSQLDDIKAKLTAMAPQLGNK